MKQVVIEMSDSRYNEFSREVGEIVGIATFIEAKVRVEDL